MIFKVKRDIIRSMKYRTRALEEKVALYSSHFPILVLTGARQVGKTTLIQHLFAESHTTIVFDPLIDVGNARSEPELFFKNNPGPLILDEIQYAPQLVPVLKRLVDKDHTPGTYILSGSQQWGILNSISESLAGRAVIINLMSFNLDEISSLPPRTRWLEHVLREGRVESLPEAVDPLQDPLLTYLYKGQLPGVQELPLEVVPAFLDSYVQTYIERDVRLMADISDLALFAQFFRLCGTLSAQEINYSQLGRDIGLTPQTTKRWLEILKQSFQWIELPPYSGNVLKRISGKNKGYFTDTGLLCHSLFLSTPSALPSHPRWGSAVETLVVMEILKIISTIQTPVGIYHWRSHGGGEVDMLLEQNGVYIPIEVKSTARPSKKDTRGIRAFRETYPHLTIGDGIIVHLGDESGYLTDTDIAVPFTSL